MNLGMMLTRLRLSEILYFAIFVFLASFFIFWGFLYVGILTDIQFHLNKVIGVSNGTMNLGANFLYFLLLYWVTQLVGNNPVALYFAATIILSLSVSLKFFITRQFLAFYGGHSSQKGVCYSLFATALIFVFSVPLSKFFGGYYYRGNVPPNVWHNSTTIFLMPFALLLFWKSYEQLVNPTRIRILTLSLLVAINVAIKPSYCFVFIVSYAIFLVKCYGVSKKTLLNLTPVFTAAILLAIQYATLYVFGLGRTGFGDTSKVTISLFTIWSSASPNIPISLLGSLLFPLAFICLYFKEARNDLLLQYTVFGHLVGIAIYAVFMETGSRQFHGNFGWQCIVTSYILYMAVSSQFIQKLYPSKIKSGYNLAELSLRNKTIFLAFSLHLMSGLLYLVKIFSAKNYF